MIPAPGRGAEPLMRVVTALAGRQVSVSQLAGAPSQHGRFSGLEPVVPGFGGFSRPAFVYSGRRCETAGRCLCPSGDLCLCPAPSPHAEGWFSWFLFVFSPLFVCHPRWQRVFSSCLHPWFHAHILHAHILTAHILPAHCHTPMHFLFPCAVHMHCPVPVYPSQPVFWLRVVVPLLVRVSCGFILSP